MPIRPISAKKIKSTPPYTDSRKAGPMVSRIKQRPIGLTTAMPTRSSPKGMIGRGVQALSGFFSSLSNNYFLDIEGKISKENLLEILMNSLVIERSVANLYQEIHERTEEIETKKQLNSFLGESRRHVILYENAIRRLDGTPEEMTSWSELQQERFESIFQTRIFNQSHQALKTFQEIYDLESLFIAEALENQIWETLKETVAFIDVSYAQNVIRDLVNEVEDEEKEHLQWIRRAYTRAYLKCLIQPALQSRAA